MLSACLGVSALAMTGAAVASKDPERMPASAGQTEYDRTANTRVDVWERVKESASEEPRSLNDLDTEIGGQTIGVAEDGSARATDLYERLVQDKENTEFGAFLEDLDYYDEVLEDPEGDYSKLGPRISRLEDMDYNWEPAGVSYSSWKLISVTELGSWEPAIGTQTTNFTQTRDRLLNYQRLVEKKERNIATQEVRVASSTYETDPRTDTISRNINVTLGEWTNTGGLHSCTTWSPATSTKPQGTEFTQTRTCKQNQQRNVSYTVASTGENPGGAWTDSQTINVSQSRPATGTKIAETEFVVVWTNPSKFKEIAEVCQPGAKAHVLAAEAYGSYGKGWTGRADAISHKHVDSVLFPKAAMSPRAITGLDGFTVYDTFYVTHNYTNRWPGYVYSTFEHDKRDGHPNFPFYNKLAVRCVE